MFGCGFMVGLMVGVFLITALAKDAVDERNREIKYLRRQLQLQAKKETTYYGGIKNEYK